MVTVKDIREIEFARQKHGYHEDEVDEFLDEVADQMEALLRENRTLQKQLEDAQAAREQAEQALSEAQNQYAHRPESAPAAGVDDSAYFRNLETTVREALLSAQRIADQTMNEAQEKAAQLVSQAQEEADALRREAESSTSTLREEISQKTQAAQTQLDGLKGAILDHKKKFRAMLAAQIEALGEEDQE